MTMRCVVLAVCVLSAGLGFGLSAADAKVAIVVDKDAQQMTVAVDGVTKFTWPVSSGNPSHETPNGSFQTFRMEADHYSKEFDDAPMPHAIFFTKQGHAIHGTDSVSRLGSPASHGCVRLSRANAATLFALVQADGVLNTTVTLTGSSQIALARQQRMQRDVARVNREGSQDYAAAGDPTELSPGSFFYARRVPRAAEQDSQALRPLYPRRVTRQMAEESYIYPADGGNGRYPAPRGYRRIYDAQGNVYYGSRAY